MTDHLDRMLGEQLGGAVGRAVVDDENVSGERPHLGEHARQVALFVEDGNAEQDAGSVGGSVHAGLAIGTGFALATPRFRGSTPRDRAPYGRGRRIVRGK